MRTNATALDTVVVAHRMRQGGDKLRDRVLVVGGGGGEGGKGGDYSNMAVRAGKAAELRAKPDGQAKEALAAAAARAAGGVTADRGWWHTGGSFSCSGSSGDVDERGQGGDAGPAAPGTSATATAVAVAAAAAVTTAAVAAGVAQAASTADPGWRWRRVIHMSSQAPLGFAPGADGTALRATALSSSVGSGVRFYRCALIVCVVASLAACSR